MCQPKAKLTAEARRNLVDVLDILTDAILRYEINLQSLLPKKNTDGPLDNLAKCAKCSTDSNAQEAVE